MDEVEEELPEMGLIVIWVDAVLLPINIPEIKPMKTRSEVIRTYKDFLNGFTSKIDYSARNCYNAL